MLQFSYKARDKNGNLIQNTISAESEDQARSLISEKGLWVVYIKKGKDGVKPIFDIELNEIISEIIGVTLKDLVVFCRQFSALVDSGIAMLRSLNILSSQAKSLKLAKVLTTIRDDVEQGISLSEAFGKHPRVFDRLFVSMVKAGETGGVLDQVLQRIASFMEYRARLQAKIQSAMTYPIVVTVFAVIIFFVMLTFILPRFSAIFNKLGGELPAYTQFLINISEFLRSPGLILLLISLGAIGFGISKIHATEGGRYFFDTMLLKIPVVGNLIQKIAIARFTRTFGTLIKSGVPILTALEIVEDSSGNAVVAKVIREIQTEVTQGGMVHKPLENSWVFPPMVTSMISIGEETGDLDAMLTKIADFYDTEVESGIEALTSLLEPFMMVFLGGMIGAVIVGMYLPMFKIFEALHN